VIERELNGEEIGRSTSRGWTKSAELHWEICMMGRRENVLIKVN